MLKAHVHLVAAHTAWGFQLQPASSVNQGHRCPVLFARHTDSQVSRAQIQDFRQKVPDSWIAPDAPWWSKLRTTTHRQGTNNSSPHNPSALRYTSGHHAFRST